MELSDDCGVTTSDLFRHGSEFAPDSVILPCQIRDDGMLGQYEQDQLPGKLDKEFHFISDMDAEVLRDGGFLSALETNMIIDFVNPKDQNKAHLTILHWEGSKWVEVRDGHVTGEGYFEATTHLTGIFVLVTK